MSTAEEVITQTLSEQGCMFPRAGALLVISDLRKAGVVLLESSRNTELEGQLLDLVDEWRKSAESPNTPTDFARGLNEAAEDLADLVLGVSP